MATVADPKITSDLPGPAARVIPLGLIVLVLGVASFCIPTMMFVVRQSWTGEEGAHGPIVLVTGLWLLYRQLRRRRCGRFWPSSSRWRYLRE